MTTNGKILKVNLTDAVFSIEELDRKVSRRYLGGYGIGLYYLLHEVKGFINPLGPENPLIFAPGLLTGSKAPAVPRYVVLSKSPLTNALGKSEAGGSWGPELKKAGFDALIITGASQKPVYLWINDNGVEIRDASHIWGSDTGFTQDTIREELGDKQIQVAQIGPAGEMLVLYANIVNNLAHFNGRNGLGAVMGSKKLKAVAVRGTKSVMVADSEKISAIFRWATDQAKKNPLSLLLHTHGTPAGIKTVNAQGSLPTHHFELGIFEKADDLASEEYNLTPKGCFACPIVCKRTAEIKEDEISVDKRYGGPEYETLVALGSNCGISDIKTIIKANELCNRYTLDTISLGMTISFSMKCYEDGIISLKDTDGLDISFGNSSVLIPLIEKIVKREGFGDTLALGSQKASEIFGSKSKKYLIVAKGQEAPMHDPRVKSGIGLQYAISVNGADHWFSQHDPFFATADSFGIKELESLGIVDPIDPLDLSGSKVRLIYYTSVLNSAYDSLGVCIFGYVARSLIPLDKLLELVRAATGWDTSLWEILKSGERALAMAREFNHRQGLGANADQLPQIYFSPLQEGPLAGKTTLKKEDFNMAVRTYHEMAGWNPQGGVMNSKLMELELSWLVGDI